MKILVIGSGGREHALCWALAKSPLCETLFCAPGNPGTAEVGTNVPIKADDLAGIVNFAVSEKIDFVVVGPDGAVVAGMVDEVTKHGIPCFGPTKVAAMLEGSKAFAKAFMHEHNIPTARFETFTDFDKAMAYLAKWHTFPVVIKASGLAAGKGAIIAQDRNEAEQTLTSFMRDGALGESGKTVVIEEFLVGEEASLFVLSDGVTFQVLPPAQDHKRLLANDRGPNTGGMGACAPSPALSDARLRQTVQRIVEPTLTHMSQRGTPFTGVLFIGLMYVGDEPYVIEYNVRFGDPETQAIMPLLNCDVAQLLYATATGTLADLQAEKKWSNGVWKPLAKPDTAVFCVVLSSRGYPGSPTTGDKILLFSQHSVHEKKGVKCEAMLFHAGTKRDENNILYTAGGRVLNTIGIADNAEAAQDAAYTLARGIRFPGKHYRQDIGARMLSALGLPTAWYRGAKLTVLGSSSGMPAVDRNSSAYWLETGSSAYLLDAGEGVSQTILRLGIDYTKLRAIFFSHTHPDHISGLPMLLQMLHLAGRKTSLNIYLPPDKVDIFTKFLYNLYLLPGQFSFEYNVLPLGPLPYDDELFKLEVFPTAHLDKYWSVAEQRKVGCVSQGFRISVADRIFVYPSDIPDIDSIAKHLSDADLLLIESTHIPPKKTAEFAAKHKIPRVILTHIPPSKVDELEEWKRLGLLHNIPLWDVAHDGVTIVF